MRKYIFLGVLFFSCLGLSGQVKWYTFNEAIKANETHPKKVFIDVYTNWCGWCKVMDNKTFTDSIVAKLLNKYYYPVKLDAESKDDYKFLGYDFSYDSNNKANQLAIALLQGKMSYPSVAYLDETNHLITSVPGYQKPEDIKPILIYFGEDHYKKINWEDFINDYRK